MVKNIVFAFLFSLFCLLLNAQNGLEKVIVEKYYISNEKDTAANLYAGVLPIGSVTYRIYVDLLPGYRFQAAYGSPTHELKISTSTRFFNNEDKGDVIPNIIPRRSYKKNTVMLDSWLSVGAAGEDYYGIMKEYDDSIETIIHESNFLQNSDKKSGEPLTAKDGLKNVEWVPRPTFYNIDDAVKAFKNSSYDSLFVIKNGAWACLGKGSVGSDSLTSNRVLIAQITTDGELNFELNVQIGTPTGASQRYVAKNPRDNEILLPSLIYNSKRDKSKKKKPMRKHREEGQEVTL